MVARYLVSGGVAAVVDLGLLYILTEFLGFWYITSVIFAFVGSIIVSFSMQKYWTFKDYNEKNFKKQSAIYLFTEVVKLYINVYMLYIFVEYLDIWYMFAQVLSIIIIAVVSFIFFKYFLFKKSSYDG